MNTEKIDYFLCIESILKSQHTYMCMVSQAFTGTLNVYELLGQYIPRSFLGAQVSCDHYNSTQIVVRKSSLCV